MSKGYFVTGTDTGVGKTLVTAALIHHLQSPGRKVAGMKPVASGCDQAADGLRNEDTDMIIRAMNSEVDYATVSPYRFLPPIAPHIASADSGMQISISRIIECYEALQLDHDMVVVEGVGGWRVPISDDQFMSDLAVELKLPVVIVVGGVLGCINHALLTADSVMSSGLEVAGWVFNQVDPGMERVNEVKQALLGMMPGSLLAEIPYQGTPDARSTAGLFTLSE